MDRVVVYVESKVHPTESVEKILSAISNVFPTIRPQVDLEKGEVRGSAEGIEALTKLYNLLRREQIRDAARSVLRKGVEG
ncbi:MAG TPA: hypothetical protein ENG07_00455, partial [Candidatus Bathyarchaeota archaeon]|nr:hypothetical protein [Candidatus Bathyarchaeota archaeon]